MHVEFNNVRLKSNRGYNVALSTLGYLRGNRFRGVKAVSKLRMLRSLIESAKLTFENSPAVHCWGIVAELSDEPVKRAAEMKILAESS